jgi:hypothetical protein
MLQDAFRRLDVKADDEGLAFVRRTLATLPTWHFAQFYIQAAPELQHDAAIADTFLHPQDRAYTVPQVLALVEDNGLYFQNWFENAVYYAEATSWLSPEVIQRIKKLPEREQWATVEMLSPGNYTHYFFARKNKPPQLIFGAPDWRRLVPHQRPGTRRIGPDQFKRMHFTFALTPAEAMLFDLADGNRTLGEIAAAGPGDARALFDRLWKQGHVMLSKPYASSSTSQ